MNTDSTYGLGLGEMVLLDYNLFAYCENGPIMGIDPNGLYNISKAIAYADKWWNKRNPDFYSYRLDCTNFVSQCLLAGGIKMSGTGRYDGWHSYKNKVTNKFLGISYTSTEWDVSEAWGTVAGIKKWLDSNPKLYYSRLTIKSINTLTNYIKQGLIKTGDVALISTKYDSKLSHAILIGNVANEKSPFKYFNLEWINAYFYGHTNNRNGKKAEYGLMDYLKKAPAKGRAYIVIYRMKK